MNPLHILVNSLDMESAHSKISLPTHDSATQKITEIYESLSKSLRTES